MPIPKNITFVTFDVYGTLIDWESGIYDAFSKEAARDGVEIDRAVLLPMFHEISREIEGGSYELYAEVLRRTAIEIAKRLEWALEPSRSGFLPDSVQRWMPFKETAPQLQKLSKKYKLGLLSNIDDKLLGQTRRHIQTDFDLVVTAQQVRSYKPELPHFTECARRMGGKRGWVHVAASHYHDVVPCVKQRVPVIWVNRNKETLDSSQKKPTAEVTSLKEAAKLPGRRLAAAPVRAVSLHPDVIAVTSAVLSVNCVIVRGGVAGAQGGDAAGETFVIDSPVLPDELDALPTLLEQAQFPQPSGLLATHGDWDHLLGRLAFPEVALGCAESTAARLQAAPGEAQRGLRAFDEELMIDRPRPLALGSLQALPVPGRCEIGDSELELHQADGHTIDGMAINMPWAGVLVVGDYLSGIEIPALNAGDTVAAYLATLERLRPLVQQAQHVVPGHGRVSDGAGALAVLDQDVAYLKQLRERGEDAELPAGRRSRQQQAIHAENVRALT